MWYSVNVYFAMATLPRGSCRDHRAIPDLLEERRERIEASSEILKCVDDMRELLQESSLSEQKAFIKSLSGRS